MNTLEFWLWKVAPSRETKILVAAACIVLASAAVIPLVNEYGTILSEVIIFWALDIVAAVTSFEYADTHHPRRVGGQPGFVFDVVSRSRNGRLVHASQAPATIVDGYDTAWCAFYVASLLRLFPGVAI